MWRLNEVSIRTLVFSSVFGRLRTTLLALLICSGGSLVAQTTPGVAQDLTWTGSENSDWFDTRNWSTEAVPTSSQTAIIDTESPNPTVISTGGAGEADTLEVGGSSKGSLTIENGGTLTVNDLGIAEDGGTGEVTVTGSGSTLTVVDELNMGDDGTATLTIADDATVSVSGSSVPVFFIGADTDSVVTLNIGAAATETMPDIAPGTLDYDGTITVFSAKEVNFVFNHNGDDSLGYTFSQGISAPEGVANIQVLSGYTIFSGDNSGFNGQVTVDGGTMVVTNSLAATSLVVGDSSTVASDLIIQSAGAVTVSGDLTIAEGSGTNGEVIVSGSDASLDVAGNIVVGNNGAGSLVVASDATVSTDNGSGTITVAKESGSTGFVSLGGDTGEAAAAAGTLDAAEIKFGSGSGTLRFNHTATSDDPLTFAIPISGKGALETEAGYTVLSGDNSGFSGTVTVDGGTLSVTGDLKGSTLIVGDTATDAEMAISDQVTVAMSGDATIGNQSGSSGALTVSGATIDGTTVTTTTLDVSGAFVVGEKGTGALEISDGALVDAKDKFTIGDAAGSTGSVLVTGSTTSGDTTAASTLKISESLVIGASGTGTLVLAEGASVEVDGGSGTVTIAQESGSTGTLVIGAQSGDTATGSADLAAKTVTFGDGAGSLLFNHSDTTGSFEFAPVLSGNGALAFEAGTTELSGNSSGFTGSTTIDGGTLSLTGTLPGTIAVNSTGTLAVEGTASGDVSVNDGGLLSGSGTISGALVVADGGTVAPGESVGTLQTQDVTFQSGSNYDVEIDSDGNADAIQSGGTVTLDGGTVDVTADAYDDNTSFTIISADTAVTGAFDEVTGDTATISYSLSYDDTDVILTQTISQAFSAIGETDNHAAVGAALDSLPTANPVLQHAFGIMTEAEVQDLYDLLSGEIHASMQGALMQNQRKVSAAVNQRLVRGSVSANGAVYAKGVVAEPGPLNGIWVTGYGGWNRIDATSNTDAADNDYGGIVAGLDREIDHYGRLGLFAAYGRTDLDQSARASSASADSFSAGLYGGATHGPLYLNLAGLFGIHSVETDRSLVIGDAMQVLTADYDATSWQFFGEAGYGFETGGTTIQPFAGLSFLQLNTDGFTETGGSAALSAASNTESTTFTTLGLRLQQEIGDAVHLQGMAGWRHAFGDVDPAATFTLAGSSPFAVTGAPIAEDALLLQAGIAVGVSDSLTIGVGYDGQFGDGSTDTGIDGHLLLRF